MESGGKAVTKRYRKKITVVLSLVLPVILLFAILNCFTTYVFYEDYKYKMNLMTEIAAKEEFSGLDAVSEFSAAVGEPPLRYRNGKAVKDQKNRI